MDVKVVDYGLEDGKNFVEYDVSGLSSDQASFLMDNLDEETSIEGDIFKVKMYFDGDVYPFQSEAAEIRPDDFISREEIEMNVFLSSFLEDM